MKEICLRLIAAKHAGKVNPDQKCLKCIIEKEKKDPGYIAARGLCSICRIYIKDGKFSKASESSLTDINLKDPN